jgi:hypothetical protein
MKKSTRILGIGGFPDLAPLRSSGRTWALRFTDQQLKPQASKTGEKVESKGSSIKVTKCQRMPKNGTQPGNKYPYPTEKLNRAD